MATPIDSLARIYELVVSDFRTRVLDRYQACGTYGRFSSFSRTDICRENEAVPFIEIVQSVHHRPITHMAPILARCSHGERESKFLIFFPLKSFGVLARESSNLRSLLLLQDRAERSQSDRRQSKCSSTSSRYRRGQSSVLKALISSPLGL